MAVQRQSKHEYVARMQGRYVRATKAEKHRLLVEVVEVTGYSRRHALRLLRHGRFADPTLARLVAAQDGTWDRDHPPSWQCAPGASARTAGTRETWGSPASVLASGGWGPVRGVGSKWLAVWHTTGAVAARVGVSTGGGRGTPADTSGPDGTAGDERAHH